MTIHADGRLLVIKQRMQIRDSPHRTVLSCARSVYATEGLAAFYISYPTTLAMSVPFTAVQFSAYEFLKTAFNPEGTYSPITHVTAGGIAGGVAAAVTTPLDVAKVSHQLALSVQIAYTDTIQTLLQTRGSSTDPRIRQARGMGEAFRIIRERNGMKGLTRGILPRVLTVAPSTAISWMSYEFFSKWSPCGTKVMLIRSQRFSYGKAGFCLRLGMSLDRLMGPTRDDRSFWERLCIPSLDDRYCHVQRQHEINLRPLRGAIRRWRLFEDRRE